MIACIPTWRCPHSRACRCFTCMFRMVAVQSLDLKRVDGIVTSIYAKYDTARRGVLPLDAFKRFLDDTPIMEMFLSSVFPMNNTQQPSATSPKGEAVLPPASGTTPKRPSPLLSSAPTPARSPPSPSPPTRSPEHEGGLQFICFISVNVSIASFWLCVCVVAGSCPQTVTGFCSAMFWCCAAVDSLPAKEPVLVASRSITGIIHSYR